MTNRRSWLCLRLAANPLTFNVPILSDGIAPLSHARYAPALKAHFDNLAESRQRRSHFFVAHPVQQPVKSKAHMLLLWVDDDAAPPPHLQLLQSEQAFRGSRLVESHCPQVVALVRPKAYDIRQHASLRQCVPKMFDLIRPSSYITV
ncbi:hypothetical protein HPB50_017127 [Hyalomma asiaticum]|uniref:Uncharacterized protein n=1 Tax=Hyalomma asiaticum TaxID=266040 RepID=A0ACB7THU2_HYAAI|nr:hypothetical protein HPB50_017127 [Hyalomma asiaticum]